MTYQKFICRACGYVYDEQLGDPECGLPAGTRFSDIPEDWECPLCGVKKADFEPYDDTQPTPATFTTTAHQGGVVIIGAGLAGWGVVDAIRTLNTTIPITLICADSGDRYHKPMLSAAISSKKYRADLVRFDAKTASDTANITLIPHTFVTNIDTTFNRLHTTRGNISYDKLVLAFGAVPIYPDTIDKSVWHINHLDRFEGLQSRLASPKQLAIIGAGMVGTEFAEDLSKAGHKVTLIDMHPYPLSGLLPKIASERILTAIQSLGIEFLGNTVVQNVTKSATGYTVALLDRLTNDSQSYHFDEVVVATGLTVDDRLPIRAGLDFDKRLGIAVNPTTLATNVPNIYALGDCISIQGTPCRYVAPHRPQATAIAHEILGLPHDGYTHKPPMIRLKNKSVFVSATGNPVGSGNWHITSDDDNGLVLQMIEHGEVVATATVR